MLRISLRRCRQSFVAHCDRLPCLVPAHQCFHTRALVLQEEKPTLTETTFGDNNDIQPKTFITPELYSKSKAQLIATFYIAFKPILLKITEEEGYNPFDTYNFIIGKPELREKIFRAAFFRFGREIPHAYKSKIVTIKDLVHWYADSVVAEKAPPSYWVPPLIAQMINQNAEIKRAEIEEERKKKREQWEHYRQKRKFERYFGDKYTIEEVESATKILESRESQS